MSATPVRAAMPALPAGYAWEATDEQVSERYGVPPATIVRFDLNTSPAPHGHASRIGSPATWKSCPGWCTGGTITAGSSVSRRPSSGPASSSPGRRARCWPMASRCSDSPLPTGCKMPLLVVGSVALDSIQTPFGGTADALGGSAVFFSVAASVLSKVKVVGVIGSDYPVAQLEALAPRGIDWSGVERAEGESFRWKGKYSYDLQSRETLETRLGVFAHFQPKLPATFLSSARPARSSAACNFAGRALALPRWVS